jgi:hypothetical protein
MSVLKMERSDMPKKERDEKPRRRPKRTDDREGQGDDHRHSDQEPGIQEHLRGRIEEARDRLRNGFGDFGRQARGTGRRVKRKFSRGARQWKREGLRSIKRPPIGTPPSGLPPSSRPPSGQPPSGLPPEIKRRTQSRRSKTRDTS